MSQDDHKQKTNEDMLNEIGTGWRSAIEYAKGSESIEGKLRRFSFYLDGWFEAMGALGEPEWQMLEDLVHQEE